MQRVCDERSLVFRKGRNVVRITAFEQGSDQADALMALANGIDNRTSAAADQIYPREAALYFGADPPAIGISERCS